MKFEPADLVVWSDAWLLAVNKPAGLPSLPDGYDPGAPYLRSVLEAEFGKLWMIHRLDKDTSGLVLLARTAEAHRALNTQFEKRQVAKVYHALVVGDPNWVEKNVRLPLRPDGDRKHRTVVDPQRGKPAHTDLRVLERFGLYTLVECIPHTGRTHQIRVHLMAQGHPVAADGLYSNGVGIFLSEFKPAYRGSRQGECPLLERAGLHARSLTFLHPANGVVQQLEAPYPKDFGGALRQLRRHSRR